MSDNEEMIKVGKDTFDKLIDKQLHEKNVAEKLEINNAINTFFSLKAEYDKQKNDIIRKISKKTHLSSKEKQKEFKQMKLKCINCNRPVGTSFGVTFDSKRETRIAKAMCGDRINPCPLNIDIDLGRITSVSKHLQELDKEIADIKQKIVLIKNDIIFGYKTTEDAVTIFNELKDDLTYAMEGYETILISYVDIYERPEDKKKLQEKEIQLYKDIQEMKGMIADFEKENNTNYITDAVNLYITQLTPKLKEIQKLKYPVMFTEHVNQTCVLTQETIDRQQTQFNISLSESGQHGKVISMVVGNKISNKSKKE